MGSKTIEITVDIIGETPKAFLVYDGGQKVWIPKSQIENPEQFSVDAKTVEITIPEWLAKEKELI